MRGGRWRPVLVAALAAGAVASLGATVTDLGPWYRGLEKPAWQPPDAAFGIVWTIVYATTAASAVLVWRNTPAGAEREWTIGLYALNGFLNVLWSLIFFRLQRPDIALWEVVALWTSILFIAVHVWRVSRAASLLMTPYLVWVSFAAALNGAVVVRNGPFRVMERFFATGAAVDVVLGVLVLEMLALTAFARSGGRRKRAFDMAFAAAPGACLLLALRAALTGAGWMWVALWLAASFPLHVADLVRRRL